MRLDHSVRTVTQCRQVAAADLIAAVGLLDLAPLAGDAELVAAARSTVAHDWRGNARKRLPQLVEALTARHQRQGDLAQSIEPELKEAHGGLRDMTVLSALAEAWLADRPHGGVDAAHAPSSTCATPCTSSPVAAATGWAARSTTPWPPCSATTTPTTCSPRCPAAGRLIAYALDGTLRRAGQSQRARTLRVGPRRPQMTPLGHGLFASDGEVVLGSARLAESDAGMPLRAGVVAARAGLPIAPATLDNLARSLAAAPGAVAAVAARPARRPPRRRPGPRHRLGGPGPGRHRRHVAARSGRRCAPGRSATPCTATPSTGTSSRPSCARPGSCAGSRRPDLLLVAALLHDIGKVRGAHDHSVTGAELDAHHRDPLGLRAA